MPSVYSTSSLSPLPSSTVITPSRPTLSMASASSRPISGSLAEIVAMCSMSSWPCSGVDCFLISSTTAWVRASMPLFSCRRASASKIRSLAGIHFLLLRPVRDNGEQVALANDEVVLAVELDLCPGVLREQDRVATLDFHIDALSVVEHSAGADRQDGALLRLLAGRIGQHDAAAGHLLLGLGLDDHAIAKRLQTRRHRSSPLPLAISFFCAKDRLPAAPLDPHKTLCKRTIRTGLLHRTGLLQFSPAHEFFCSRKLRLAPQDYSPWTPPLDRR